MNIYLDIETGPLPKTQRTFAMPDKETMSYGNATKPETKERIYNDAVEKWESGDGAALDATTGQILLIGLQANDFHSFHGPEKILLENVWGMIDSEYSRNGCHVIGHNILAFDIPFMIRRSLILGAKVPSWVIMDISQYSPKIFKDTMRFWQFGDRRTYVKLSVLCTVFGIPFEDNGVNGANFAEMWATDREMAIAYNMQDVMAVKALWERMS